MSYQPQNPLIVQSDRSILLEVQNPHFETARDALARFAELVKSPEYVHTYQITPLSLWNAAASGLTAEQVLAGLAELSKFPLPESIRVDIADYMSRYGRVRLERQGEALVLTSGDALVLKEMWHHKGVRPFLL